jgi:hypothetical protein
MAGRPSFRKKVNFKTNRIIIIYEFFIFLCLILFSYIIHTSHSELKLSFKEKNIESTNGGSISTYRMEFVKCAAAEITRSGRSDYLTVFIDLNIIPAGPAKSENSRVEVFSHGVSSVLNPLRFADQINSRIKSSGVMSLCGK